MFKRSVVILLLIALAGGNAAATTALCAGLSRGGAGLTPKKYCRMTHDAATLMICCQHKYGPSASRLERQVSGCCQMSAPLPVLPDPALPASLSDEARLQALSQLLNSSDRVSSSTLTYLLAGWFSPAVAFSPDRSDTYLLASTFRI